MAKNIFVSYNFNDREVVRTVKSMFQNNGGSIQGKAVFVDNDVSDEGSKAIDKEIKQIMNKCDAALFVIGNNNHNSPWINREAELAISLGISIVLTRLPGTNGGRPNILAHSHHSTSEWNPEDLSYYLNRC